MNLLEFDSLYLEFDLNRVLSSIYMKCETGKITGLLGRNGSGKSCLMKIVFGSLHSSNKSIRFNGIPLLRNYFSQKIISYLSQDQLLPPFLKIEEAFQLFKVDVRLLKQSYPDYVPLLGRRACELSGGQLRFLEVFLILHAQHPICILDEPFSGLAPLQIEQVQEMLLIARRGKGIIITDHMHRYVRSISDALYVLSQGRTHLIRNEQQLIDLGYLPPQSW